MSDSEKPPLPRNLRAVEPDAMRANIAEADDASGAFVLQRPMLVGVHCEVQHPVSTGKPPSSAPGFLAAGSMEIPGHGGQVMVNLSHGDGTTLAAMLSVDQLSEFAEALLRARNEAWIVSATQEGPKQ